MRFLLIWIVMGILSVGSSFAQTASSGLNMCPATLVIEPSIDGNAICDPNGEKIKKCNDQYSVSSKAWSDCYNEVIACRQKIQKENDEINNRNAFIYKCQKAFPDRPQGRSTRASNPNPSGRAKETEDNPAAKNSKNAVNSTRTDVDVGAANHARQKNFRGGGALAQAHAALRTAAAEFDSDQCGASLKGLCCNRDGPFVRRGPSFMKYSKDFKAARLGGLFLGRCRPVLSTDQRQSRTEMIQEFSTTSAIFSSSCLLITY